MSTAPPGHVPVPHHSASHATIECRPRIREFFAGIRSAALVNDPDFNESEHPLVVEVARSLQQRLDQIIRTWTIAIPPDQPFAELIVGG
jgi:hypothetical protein